MNLNRKLVTKEGLLEYIQDIDVFRFYSGQEVELKVAIHSPIKAEESPSFGYFIGESGEICFKDFRLGAGDFVKLVQLKFGLNYFEALSKIAIDFDLRDEFIVKDLEKSSGTYDPNNFKNKSEILKDIQQHNLGKKRRAWTAQDYAFWLQFGIDQETLLKYHVDPIDYIFINQKPIYANKYAYAFTENKDKTETYKIYQPFNKDYKWLNNHNDSIWQGWEQLPKKGKLLIITKSLKDVMAIDSLLGTPSVALQSESIKPKPYVVNELIDRFENILLLYDNDFDSDINWGRQFGERLSNEFNFRQIEIDEKYKSKDFSDLVKNKGIKEAKLILNNIIEDALECPF